MDFLSYLLYLLFTLILTRAFLSISTRSRCSRAHSKLPPGPFPFPFVGNLFKLGDKPHKSLAELAKTYGPIMSLKLGQKTTMVISSSDMAKEILQKNDVFFSNRTLPDAIRALKHNEVSLVWMSVSNQWRNLRKISNSEIFTTQRLDANQDLRRRKVQELLTHVEDCCRAGVVVDIGRAAFSTTLNLLSNTIFSEDIVNPSSDEAQEWKEFVWSIMEEAGKPNFADFFPLLRKIDPQGIRRRMTVHFEKMFGLFDSMINKRLASRKVVDSPTRSDVIDILLNICEEKTYPIDRDVINHLLLDLFVAGTDTTANTLEWAMVELLRNPAILSKARQETQQIIGKDKVIEESDVGRLPYLHAIIKETFRLHPAAPLLVPHGANAEVEISGFKVPNGAEVLVNAWAIGRDPNIWENPNSFVPERFVGSEIDVRGRSFELIPFGAGRRICPGMPLALRMIQLMLASLLHSFDWKLEDGMKAEEMDMEDKFGITLRKAKPLRVIPVNI